MSNFTTPAPTSTADPGLCARVDRIETLVVAVVDEFVKHLAATETTPRAARRASNRDGGGRIRPNWRN